MDYDAIVIGSGFGGAVSACRLAEAGYRVLVLERGRRWNAKGDKGGSKYPRQDGDPWWFSNEAPELWNGWLDLRVFKHMAVLSGAAVGGGSLVYANISAVPAKSVFDAGWPPEITWDAMAPHFATVGRVMNVQPVPDNQWPKRMKLMHEAANAIGAGSRFQKMELAVSFDPDWNYDLPDPFNVKHSKPYINEHGVEQGRCVHLGNCDIGCDVEARHTLDRNYLAIAERHKAEVRPLHLVTGIEPTDGGYKVSFDHLDDRRRKPGSASARLVVVSAGSIGSTELLLHCRDVAGTLANVSARLGYNWSSNGDFLTPAFHETRVLEPTQGPTITSAINFLDGSRPDRKSYWIQDGGFPNVVANWLMTATATDARVQAFLQFVASAVRQFGPLENVMPWFAQGVDAANGTLRLKRRWWLVGARNLDLDWDIAESAKVIEAIIATHKELSKTTAGTALVPPSWTLDRYLITPHPLGGCNMAANPANGVVDHKGEVFGHRNLFVIDGAMVPEALGVNPSRSIAALAEHAVGRIVGEGR
jgi:cholesterol oxidase